MISNQPDGNISAAIVAIGRAFDPMRWIDDQAEGRGYTVSLWTLCRN
jgi:hypothetical protein